MSEPIDSEYYEVVGRRSIAEKLLMRARDEMYRDFLRIARPDEASTILDVGVSDVQVPGANWLETVYPHRSMITACGLGEGKDFKTVFPEIDYTPIVANAPLPYADKSFAIATANAVLEHVGSVANQRAFVAELVRVADTVFVTVPHRYFPVEHHTGIPFLHYLDGTFAVACRVLGKEKWSRAENLILMSSGHLRSLAPPGGSVGHTGLKLGPFSSNLFFHYRGAGR